MEDIDKDSEATLIFRSGEKKSVDLKPDNKDTTAIGNRRSAVNQSQSSGQDETSHSNKKNDDKKLVPLVTFCTFITG